MKGLEKSMRTCALEDIIHALDKQYLNLVYLSK